MNEQQKAALQAVVDASTELDQLRAARKDERERHAKMREVIKRENEATRATIHAAMAKRTKAARYATEELKIPKAALAKALDTSASSITFILHGER